MGALFHNKTTTSTGKLSNMAFLTSLSPFVSDRTRDKAKKYIVLLVGCGRQLPRHIREAKALGFNESEMIVIECQSETFQSLERKAAKIKFKGELVEGDFLTNLKMITACGYRVDCVSFDAVCLPDKGVKALALFCKSHSIREIHFVLSTRGLSEWVKSWAPKNGLRPRRPKRWARDTKKRCWPVKEVSHLLVAKSLGRRYDVNSQGYKGISPMVGISAILTK